MKKHLVLNLGLVLLVVAGLGLSACSNSGTRVTYGAPLEEFPDVPREDDDYPLEVVPSEEAIAALFKKSDAELKAKEYDFAKITLKQITLREPYNLKAHEKYQDILFSQGRFASAYHEFFDLLAEDEQRGEWLWLFARVVLAKRPNTTLQVQTLDEATRSKSDQLMTEAQAALNEGNRDVARTKLSALTKLVPQHIGAHRLSQDLSLAVAEEATTANALTIKIAELKERYSLLMEEHELNGDMVYLYERVAALEDPIGESTRLSTLRYMKAVAFDTPGYWLYYGFGRAAMERAAMSEEENEKLALMKLSERLYQVCTSSDELIGEGWFGLGLAQQAVGNLGGAKESLAFALEVAGNSPDSEIVVAYGETLERLNENEAALALYREHAPRFPKDERFVYLQGRVHYVMGHAPEALALFEKAYAMLTDKQSDFAKGLSETIEQLK